MAVQECFALPPTATLYGPGGSGESVILAVTATTGKHPLRRAGHWLCEIARYEVFVAFGV